MHPTRKRVVLSFPERLGHRYHKRTSILGCGARVATRRGERVIAGQAIGSRHPAGGRGGARHGPRGGGVQRPGGGVSYLLRRR